MKINKQIEGLIHITGSRKISKFELLMLLRETFMQKDVMILPIMEKRSDKSLLITREGVLYQSKDYSIMISELKQWMEARPEIYQSYFQKGRNEDEEKNNH